MKIDILTLFPEFYNSFLNVSVIKRAIDNKKIDINIIDFRKYSKDKHHKVDDTPYGGGSGMVLRVDVLYDAIKSLKKDDTKVILLTPSGTVYNQKLAYKLSNYKHIILICGHYEGFDERIRNFVDLEISIGDYVLTGGEIPSLILVDSITRLLDGVINKDSHINDSFNNNLLDYPTYTKPYDFLGYKVPDVLLSGNHKEINNYRLNESIKKTKLLREDLYKKYISSK